MKKVISLLLIIFSFSQMGYSQSDVFEELKKTYDQLREEFKDDSALVVAKKMNAWALQFETDSSLRYAVSLRYIGNSLREINMFINEYDSTLFYLNKSFQALDRQQRAESLDGANSLNDLGNVYSDMGNYKAAEFNLKKSLEIRKRVLREEHPDYVSNLIDLGEMYKGMDDYKSAEPYYKHALEVRKIALGEEHPDYASSLNSLLGLYWDMSEYRVALPYHKQALEIQKKSLGEEHPTYASSLNNLGILYSNIGDYKAALPYHKQALEIQKKALGEEHPDYASSLNILGNLFSDMGDYKSAEPYYKKALEIEKKVLGEEDQDYAYTLINFAALYRDMGDYRSSELYFKKALEILKNALGEENAGYASSLNNLGILYFKMGNYKSAESHYKQSLEINKKVFGVEHINFGANLNNLANLYRTTGDYKAAVPYYKQALEIVKRTSGEEHRNYGTVLYNLGILYSEMGDYKAAEPYYKQALEIRKNALGEEHSDYASSLGNLGILYRAMGDYKAAEPYFQKALEIRKKALGEGHPDYISTEVSYAYLLSNTNREKEAYQILTQNFSKIAKQTADNFEWLTENQKEAYWKKESSFFEGLSVFANDVVQKVPEAAGLNYDAAILIKSKLLAAKITSEDFYLEIVELNEELGYRRRLLAKLESEGSLEKSRLDKLNVEVDSLDKRLTLSWPEYAQQKKNLQITWNQVQQNLEEGEAAIEFVRFENKSDSLIYYNALVLKKGDSQPMLIKLCAEQDLQAISPEKGYSAYYGLVWQPLETALEGIKTIYYAPTGDLYNVPFHAIYAPKGTGDEIVPEKKNKKREVIYPEYAKTEQDATYLMDRYTLHQLTSTRYLAMGLKQKAQEAMGTTMAMVGAVNYDYLPGTTATPIKNKKGGSENRSSNYAYGKLDYLEGTKTEVDLINQQVSSASWETTVLEGNDATEEKITQLEGKESREILHLATHGYAFSEFDYQDTTISQNSLKYSYRYSTNPMVRSGLILAGGNWAWTGSDTLARAGAEQNGILTALEVSQLNLKKTKLVVLSACETGLGKIEGNEGTFGLKRGFKLAGVEQLIVSLWSIPDQETQELMSLFYSDLTQTKNPTFSFQKAQQAMREKYPTSPFLWAGFVLVR